jgi:hypothetical protein
MNKFLKGAAVAALATVAMSSAASAAVVVSQLGPNGPAGDAAYVAAGQTLIADFDGFVANGYNLAINAPATVIVDGGSLDDQYAAPPGTTTDYLAVLGPNGSASLTATKALKEVSIYMGSPDTYNSITFHFLSAPSITLKGAQIAQGVDGAPIFNGNQGIGLRLNYNFGAERVTQIDFGSAKNSFELDNIAGSAVPEPATWAMMIAGFGLAGSAIRRRRHTFAVA